MGILIQPGAENSPNYLATLAQPFGLQKLQPHMSSQHWQLMTHFHPGAKANIWAAKEHHRGWWTRLAAGDLVLFTGNNEVHGYGYVTAKAYVPGNNHVWPEGADWDYVFALDQFHALQPGTRIPYASLAPVMNLTGMWYRSARYHDVPKGPVEGLLGGVTAPPLPPAPASPPSLPKTSQRKAPPETGKIGQSVEGASFNGINANQQLIDANYEERERGNEGHANTLDQLIQLVRARGLDATRGERDYNFDLGWQEPTGEFVVCEVKSLTPKNERHQIRMGLGQVLDYAHTLAQARHPQPVRPLLVVEQEPSDAAHWQAVCNSVDVTLTWPDRLADDVQ